MLIVYRFGLAAIALIALIALFVCQYRLSARLARREAKLDGQQAHEEPGAIES